MVVPGLRHMLAVDGRLAAEKTSAKIHRGGVLCEYIGLFAANLVNCMGYMGVYGGHPP